MGWLVTFRSQIVFNLLTEYLAKIVVIWIGPTIKTTMHDSSVAHQDMGKEFVCKVRLAFAMCVALTFISGLLLINIDLGSTLDLSTHYYPNLSYDERTRYSAYDWEHTRSVEFDLQVEKSGMVILRAMNGEIVYQTFLERNITEQVVIRLPDDLNRLLVEYKDKTEYIEIPHAVALSSAHDERVRRELRLK